MKQAASEQVLGSRGVCLYSLLQSDWVTQSPYQLNIEPLLETDTDLQPHMQNHGGPDTQPHSKTRARGSQIAQRTSRRSRNRLALQEKAISDVGETAFSEVSTDMDNI